jgi:hypothetical protein
MANDKASPAFSFQGWSFNEWFYGNGKTIKEIAKVGIPMLVAWLSTKSPTWTILSTLIGKLVLDSLEYFIKERPNTITIEPYLPDLDEKVSPTYETYN